MDIGAITDAELKAEASLRLPEYLREPAFLVYDHWYENLTFIKGIPELIFKLKSLGGSIYLLSDNTLGFAEGYRNVPKLKELFDIFDGLVFSAELGIAKPSREIFNYLIDKYSIDVKETVFIDDSQRNISGAQNVGIFGYRFDGNAKKLKEYFEI